MKLQCEGLVDLPVTRWLPEPNGTVIHTEVAVLKRQAKNVANWLIVLSRLGHGKSVYFAAEGKERVRLLTPLCRAKSAGDAELLLVFTSLVRPVTLIANAN